MWVSKRALVPRRDGTGRQTTHRLFAVTASDFDGLLTKGDMPAAPPGCNVAASDCATAAAKSPAPVVAVLGTSAAKSPAPAAAPASIMATGTPGGSAALLPAVPAGPVPLPAAQALSPAPHISPLKRLMNVLERPWRARGSGRPTKRRVFAFTLAPLEAAERLWHAQQAAAARAAAEAAAAAAAAEAAAAAAAAAEAAAQEKMQAAAAVGTPAAAAASLAHTPGGSASRSRGGSGGWTPVEGVPELRSRPRPPRRAATAAAAPAPTPSFSPMEGVPETARGFRRPRSGAIAPAPTPATCTHATDARTPLAQQLARAARSRGTPPSSSSGRGGADLTAALAHVDSVVAGITSASPNTPASATAALCAAPSLTGAASVYRAPAAHKPGFMEVAIQYSATRTRAAATAMTADAAVGASYDNEDDGLDAGAGGSDGCVDDEAGAGPAPAADGSGAATGGLVPSPVRPQASAACGTKRPPPATPREGRLAKSRKSLAGDGLALGQDGRRVSTRARQPPLEFWRNERKEYSRDHRSLPTVKRYVARTPDPLWPAPEPTAAVAAHPAASKKPRSKQTAGERHTSGAPRAPGGGGKAGRGKAVSGGH